LGSLPIATATNGGASKVFFDNFERDGLQDPNVKPRRSGNAVIFTNMFDGTFWRIDYAAGIQYHLLSAPTLSAAAPSLNLTSVHAIRPHHISSL
jgi:hypothetical protein